MDKRQITDTIVIHCTQTPKDMDIDVAKVTEWHTQRGFDTIGYHYLIKRDGTLQTGRDEDAALTWQPSSSSFSSSWRLLHLPPREPPPQVRGPPRPSSPPP